MSFLIFMKSRLEFSFICVLSILKGNKLHNKVNAKASKDLSILVLPIKMSNLMHLFQGQTRWIHWDSDHLKVV